jgi:hypothetical protein
MIGALPATAQERGFAEAGRRFNVDLSAIFSADPYSRWENRDSSEFVHVKQINVQSKIFSEHVGAIE